MRIPGVASAADAGRNMYSMFQLGFNPRASGNPFRGAIPGVGGNGLSMGGLLTAGGLAGIGAAAGAAAGSVVTGDIGGGALAGATIGAAALPAAGLAARAGMAIAPPLMRGVGAVAMKAPNIGFEVGKGMIGGVGGMNPQVGGNLFQRAGRSLGSPVKRYAQSVAGLGSSLVRFDAEASNLSKVKFTGPVSGAKAGWAEGKSLAGKLAKGGAGALVNGHSMLWGAGIATAAAGTFQAFNKIHMGQMDGQVTRVTPRTPAYFDNAGASGDLVFALNANRRG